METIVLTGGGTAGHVTPNIALIPGLKALNPDLHYIGTKNGIEKRLIEDLGIKFHAVHSGKLRRYFDLKNLTDLFKIIAGFFESIRIIRKLKPCLVFSKGGYVSCPVVWASWLLKIPVVIHESDVSPGLANKLSIPFAAKICYSFPETAGFLPKGKAILTGLPVREEFSRGNKSKGLAICGFNEKKPVLLVIGGSQGSENLNKMVRSILFSLLYLYDVCHICGNGNIDLFVHNKGYKQFEYVMSDLPDIFAAADVILSRAGATSVFEIIASKKAGLLVPLGKDASRGDQIDNAYSLYQQGLCNILGQSTVSPESLLNAINYTYENRESYIKAISSHPAINGVSNVLDVITAYMKNK